MNKKIKIILAVIALAVLAGVIYVATSPKAQLALGIKNTEPDASLGKVRINYTQGK